MRGYALVLCLAAAGSSGAEETASQGLGLMVGRVGDAAARGRLQAGLADPNPEVRAAAVRVVNVSGVGELVPALVAALSKEREAEPGREMIRFLASMNRPELDAAAIDGARRIGGGVHVALADGLGRRGAGAAVHFGALRSLGFEDLSWRVFYGLASRDSASVTPLADAILREGDPQAWRGLMLSCRQKRVALEEGVAVRAVQSASAEIRRETYWQLALFYDARKPLGSDLGGALDSSVEAGKEAADSGAVLAFEVLQRLRGRAARPMLETLKSIGPDLVKQMPGHAVSVGHIGGVVDKNERKAVAAVFFADNPKFLDDWASKPGLPPPYESGAYSVVQTIGQLPAGYVTDVIESSGCTLGKEDKMMGGELAFGADGRPRHAGMLSNRSSKECNEAVRALLVSSLAPLGVPVKEGQKSLFLVPARREFLACIDETARASAKEARTNRVGSRIDDKSEARIEPPQKTRNVAPEYPAASKGVGRQGVVVLDARISPTGCVSGISLLAGVDTPLDLAAIDAVSGWAYKPTLLEGKPVPVEMTVTVNFRLN